MHCNDIPAHAAFIPVTDAQLHSRLTVIEAELHSRLAVADADLHSRLDRLERLSERKAKRESRCSSDASVSQSRCSSDASIRQAKRSAGYTKTSTISTPRTRSSSRTCSNSRELEPPPTLTPRSASSSCELDELLSLHRAGSSNPRNLTSDLPFQQLTVDTALRMLNATSNDSSSAQVIRHSKKRDSANVCVMSAGKSVV